MRVTGFKSYFKAMIWPLIVEELKTYTADRQEQLAVNGFRYESFSLYSVAPYLDSDGELEVSILANALVCACDNTDPGDPGFVEDYFVTCNLSLSEEANKISNLRITEPGWDSSCTYIPDENEPIRLDDELIPCFSKESMEKFVARLIAHHPAANVIPVDVSILANVLGIPMFHQSGLTADHSIFGMTIFCNETPHGMGEAASATIRDSNGKGVIVLDDSAAYNMGSLNFTAAHEIAHWLLHRHHFQLYGLLDGGEGVIVKCSTTGNAELRGSQRHDKTIPLLEWQANLFASRLLAPSKQYKEHLNKIIELLKVECSPLEIARRAIKLTATRFGLSLTAGRIRAIECGCVWARGIGLRHDSAPVADYIVTTGMLGNDETCEISWNRFRELCYEDSELKLAVETRTIVWVDSHVVINDFKYVRWGKAWPELTTYAREHANDCFLVFKTHPVRDGVRENLLDWSGVALRGDGNYCKRDVIEVQKKNSKKSIEQIFETARARKDDIAKFNAILKDDNLVRGEKLSYVISAAGFTQDKLMTMTGLRKRSLSKMCSRECGEHIDCLSVVAICAGLALPFQVSDELLTKLRCPLGEDMDGYFEYLNILNDPSQMRVWQWNCYLLEQDCLPLTDMLDDDYTKLEGKMPDNRKKMLHMYRERKQSIAILDNGNDEQSE